MSKIPTPKSWKDLGKEEFYDFIVSVDPRRSSSSITVSIIILQKYGWVEGWKVLTAIASNTKKFVNSSSAPIKSVISGEAAASMTIGYFANSKIIELGANKLSFVFPKGETIVNPDPISILKGAPNKLQAKRFIEFILSEEAQKYFSYLKEVLKAQNIQV